MVCTESLRERGALAIPPSSTRQDRPRASSGIPPSSTGGRSCRRRSNVSRGVSAATGRAHETHEGSGKTDRNPWSTRRGEFGSIATRNLAGFPAYPRSGLISRLLTSSRSTQLRARRSLTSLSLVTSHSATARALLNNRNLLPLDQYLCITCPSSTFAGRNGLIRAPFSPSNLLVCVSIHFVWLIGCLPVRRESQQGRQVRFRLKRLVCWRRGDQARLNLYFMGLYHHLERHAKEGGHLPPHESRVDLFDLGTFQHYLSPVVRSERFLYRVSFEVDRRKVRVGSWGQGR